jgi:hypothetical protein
MKITRTSPLTGELNTLDLPIDSQSLQRWRNGEPARNCFLGLSAHQRQFLLAGFMPGEYDLFCREPSLPL